jgi:flagellar biosynthesis protein FlhG
MKTKEHNSPPPKEKHKIICFSSGKGGVGKTSISVNLAVGLAQRGKKVLLVDGDLGLANVDIVLGLNARHTMREIVEEGASPNEILEEIIPGFSVLPASSGVPEMANLAYEEQAFLTDAVEQIIDAFDYVFVDSAAGIGDSVLWFNNWADDNVIVLTPDPTSLTDAYALIKVLHTQYGKKCFNLIINNVKGQKEGEAVFLNMSTVLGNFLGIVPEFLGAIPQDTAVVQAVRKQRPFLIDNPDTKAGRAILKIVDLLF